MKEDESGLDRAQFGGRAAALDTLAAVLRRHVPLDDALTADGLSSRDRAFCRLLSAGVLRRLGQIDALLGLCLSRPLPKAAGAVTDILRLGCFQLLFLGTAPHAAIDTAVEMTGALGFSGYRKLVNGVLRRLSREGQGWVEAQDAPRLNTPDWLWNSWMAAYGAKPCRAIAEAHLNEAPLDLSIPTDAPLWAERLGGALLPTGSVRLTGAGAVTDLPGFAEGAWWVQDAAAALPARLFPDVRGARVADLCAAPGGKTAQLAAAGAHVTAFDRSAKRLERLKANLDRLGLEAETITADAASYRSAEPFDAVLLDAPCSATGTLRRHPDIAHLKGSADVGKLARTQARLLKAAWTLLKPGGMLVYCTCSLEPDEGERQIDDLLASDAPLRRLPIRAAEVGGLDELVSPAGDLRSLPCHLSGQGGMDGFFAARLIRT